VDVRFPDTCQDRESMNTKGGAMKRLARIAIPLATFAALVLSAGAGFRWL